MIKHTQTSRRQFADELFELVSPFREIGAYRVKWKTAKIHFFQNISFSLFSEAAARGVL